MDIDSLREKLQELNDASVAIAARADAEKRDMTADEQKEMDGILEEFDLTKSNIDRLSRLEQQSSLLTKGVGRQTTASGPDVESDDDGDEPQPKPKQQRQLSRGLQRVPDRVPAEYVTEKKGGFRHLGEMAVAVRRACGPARIVDDRLQRLAPTTYGSEGVGADGGFAVPPDFRNMIMEKVMAEESLVSMTDQLTASGNSITIPKDETTPWQTTGGIQAYWDGENNQLTQSKPGLEQATLRLNKLTALVPMTDELLEDAAAMDAYLRRKAPEKIAFKLNLAIVQGTGVGQPLGMLNAGCTVSVAKESSQVADTLVANNVIKMYSRMYAPCRSRAVWLIHQDIEPMLYKLSLPGTDNVGNAVTGWGGLVYLPANGLSGQPYGTLFGRPVIPTQACETLGDKGDIFFADLSQYMTVLKSGPNPRVDVSIHLWFDYDTTAYRFILRVGGQPWWATSVAARDGSNTYSCFVTLDERA